MASFKFGSSKKIYTIEGMNKEYVIDVANVDTMKAWREKLPPIVEAIEALKNGGGDESALIALVRDIVNMILDGDFEPLWDLSGHNLYAMLGLLVDLSKVIKEAQGDIGKVYGF